MRCLTISVLALTLGAGLAHAQADWSTNDIRPMARAMHATAWDATNQKLVLFGGGMNSGYAFARTWLYDTTSGWTLANPVNSPSTRADHGMVWDATNKNVVLFGGRDGATGNRLNDTWIWDGTNWTDVTATAGTAPYPREPIMAFDPSSGMVIVFSGYPLNANDTWAWNGTTWQQLTPTGVSPPARSDTCMATDWANNCIVLFGGWNSGFLNDTWTWKNGAWTAHTIGLTSMPTPRSEYAMAYDGTRVVLFGGNDNSAAVRVDDTWHWDGAAWTQVMPATKPPRREEHTMSFNSTNGHAMMFGGWDDPIYGHYSDLWIYNGGVWSTNTPVTPVACACGAMAHDPNTGISITFGGYRDRDPWNGDTWALQNGTWTQLFPTSSPTPRSEVNMSFDRIRGEYVLFGGREYGTNAYLNDTWTFKNGNWTLENPATVPTSRRNQCMDFDDSRGTVVMFSGYDGTAGYLTDTWEWDGTNWTQITPAIYPPARHDSYMAYDAKRGELIVFGGWGGMFLNDTWAFRAGNWVQLAPANAPTPRSEFSMAYDRVRGVIVLFGGEDASGRQNDTWEWDGTDWTQCAPLHSPLPREEAPMVFDEVMKKIIVFQGWDLGHYHDTWYYGGNPCASPYVDYGNGCPGSGGFVPYLSLDTCAKASTLVSLTVSKGYGGNMVYLLLGANAVNLPIGPTGCTLLISPVFPAPIPLPLGGVGPGNGIVTVAGVLPAGTAGFTVRLQAFCGDPLPAQGYSNSNGIELKITP